MDPDELEKVIRYGTHYGSTFSRLLAQALRWATASEAEAIKAAFPEWWDRCLRNTEILRARGVEIGQ